MNIVFEKKIEEKEVCTEEGGASKVVEVSGLADFFVRLHSYSDTHEHGVFDSLVGKRVRVTIEVVNATGYAEG